MRACFQSRAAAAAASGTSILCSHVTCLALGLHGGCFCNHRHSVGSLGKPEGIDTALPRREGALLAGDSSVRGSTPAPHSCLPSRPEKVGGSTPQPPRACPSQSAAPHTQNPHPAGLEGAQEFALLTCSQLLLWPDRPLWAKRCLCVLICCLGLS